MDNLQSSNCKTLKDPHGQAILNYYKGDRDTELILHNSYGEPEEMPIEVFFSDPDDFTEIERTAMTHCRGTVLDIGAAAGSHALFLQAFDAPVTALDYSPGCAEVMRSSGVKVVAQENFQNHSGQYDTILLMMNGLGIAGTLDGIPILLNKCQQLLNEGGQIVLDSSDISYLYEDGLQKPKGYFGEVQYQYEYQGEKGDWFNWVYADQQTLIPMVESHGLQVEIVLTDEESGQYLAIINGF